MTEDRLARRLRQIPRCGVCSAPTMTGVICRSHWDRLLVLLGRVAELAPVAAPGLPGRYGDATRSSSTIPPTPVNFAAMDARQGLVDALVDAQRAIGTRMLVRDSVAAVALLRSRLPELRESWAAPVLVSTLEAVVRDLARAVDKPPARLRVPASCPECGPSHFRPVGGLLECEKCSGRWTIGAIRDAA